MGSGVPSTPVIQVVEGSDMITGSDMVTGVVCCNDD
jgi:hypothetical protein